MRLVSARLADASHTLPWPGQPGRLFNPAGEMIDADDPFWINLLADGSLVEATPLPPAAAPPAVAAIDAAD